MIYWMDSNVRHAAQESLVTSWKVKAALRLIQDKCSSQWWGSARHQSMSSSCDNCRESVKVVEQNKRPYKDVVHSRTASNQLHCERLTSLVNSVVKVSYYSGEYGQQWLVYWSSVWSSKLLSNTTASETLTHYDSMACRVELINDNYSKHIDSARVQQALPAHCLTVMTWLIVNSYL